jgi:hypothetical protein
MSNVAQDERQSWRTLPLAGPAEVASRRLEAYRTANYETGMGGGQQLRSKVGRGGRSSDAAPMLLVLGNVRSLYGDGRTPAKSKRGKLTAMAQKLNRLLGTGCLSLPIFSLIITLFLGWSSESLAAADSGKRLEDLPMNFVLVHEGDCQDTCVQ